MDGVRQWDKSLGLVLPTLREAANIERVVRLVVGALRELALPFEVIVVDDGSSDGTGAIVRSLMGEFSELRLVERPAERGLSGAILDGWAASTAGVVGVMDADGQHPPELLACLWAAIEGGADLALASRYAHGATTGRWRLLRRAASELAVWVCRPLQRRERAVSDPMSGFFLLRQNVVASLPPLQRSGFKLLLEILVRAPQLRIREVPFCFGVRSGGRSKAGLPVVRDYLRLLAGLYSARLGAGSEAIASAPVEEPLPRPTLRGAKG